VQLGQVKLEIEGAEARALFKVRLEHVRATLEEILEHQEGGVEGRTRGTLGEGTASDARSSSQEES
jgi:hypothetical protein